MKEETKTIKFQYYPAHINSVCPIGWVSIDEFIHGHKAPKQQTRVTFEKITEAEKLDNKALKAELKQNNLYFFTPCVHISKKRDYNSIKIFTGIMVLDFDHFETIEMAEGFKQYIFTEYESIIVCYLSPSKHGVKALVKIPIVETVSEFKEYFFGMAAEFQNTLNEETFKHFDISNQNPVLPLFQSFDPTLSFRRKPATWQEKGLNLGVFDYENPAPPPKIDVSEKSKETVVKIIHSGMQSISEPGHPQLRSLCLSIGGYVATGYIDNFEAIQLIDYLIESHHYLKKGVEGYKKTAHWAINQGQNKPLVL